MHKETFDAMRRDYMIIGLMLLWLLVFALSGCPEQIEDDDTKVPDHVPPQTVFSFAAKAEFARVTLEWDTPTEDDAEINKDLYGVILVRAEGRSPDAFPVREREYRTGDALGYGTVIADLDPSVEVFVDETVEKGKTYFYEAISYDEVPNYAESAELNATPGSLVQGRLSHEQTVLADGRVLLTGGIGYNGPLDTAEMYNPTTGQFTMLVAHMSLERFAHTATLLDDGRVLIVGGYREGFAKTLAEAEIFDPADNSFTRLESEMNVGRALHTATLLPDGRVLIAGGTDSVDALASLTVFDPETETFIDLADAMMHPRYGHVAVLGESAAYLIGGFDGYEMLSSIAAVQLDDLSLTDVNGRLGNETEMLEARLYPTASVLPDGGWLIAGGQTGTLSANEYLVAGEIFDPAGETMFAATGDLARPRAGHRATVLADGAVLITGGIGDNQTILDDAEVYRPESGTFIATASMRLSRTVHGQSLLPDGRVLVTGGNRSTNIFRPEPASTAEIYDPDTGRFSVVGVD